MSIQQDCPGCFAGEHDRHNPSHGLRPGLIGGSYCSCRGDCAPRTDGRIRRWLDEVLGPDLPSHGQFIVDPRLAIPDTSTGPAQE